jgi:Pyridoxamine 5'-phosphate oxidase
MIGFLKEFLPMGKIYLTIDDSMREFMMAQPIFFVGSAPLDPRGHLNVSPKGLDTLRILGPTTAAYIDLTGSGIETVSHLRENGRIVLMFCAFQGPPKILRLHGKGRVIEPHEEEFAALAADFPNYQGARAIIVIELSRIADSCGFGVPLLKTEAGRTQLTAWSSNQGPDGLKRYRSEKNQRSIDGLPGLKISN